MNIFLVGFMGSGKSTLGKRVANILTWDFVDLDDVIEQSEGYSIPELFSQFGEEKFRQCERKALENIVNKNNQVIATGGGAPCYKDNMQLMNRFGITVYLKINPGILGSRLKNSHIDRPLIKGKTEDELLEFIRAKLEEREKYYSQSKLTIEGDNIKASDIITQLKSISEIDYEVESGDE